MCRISDQILVNNLTSNILLIKRKSIAIFVFLFDLTFYSIFGNVSNITESQTCLLGRE